ncbi:hypothetical protein KIW84_015323 [Lathyrus oleraceus]|uniref:GDSL esterase/lipase n=1 Tax=Pisum sativum TaxID=3888 RepID=A0A9D5H0G7_PEA|nr:hypothetical protein KIW84_015323 [Pisum sativum]
MAVYSEMRWSIVILFLVTVASPPLIMAECSSYSSIFSFGDSMADTGNLFYSIQDPSLTCLVPPYGQTYFHHVSGRCSDGRLIIDFIAESLGIPMVKPYLGIKNGVLEDSAAKDGANFAVIGATALDVSFFEERGVYNLPTNEKWDSQILIFMKGKWTIYY